MTNKSEAKNIHVGAATVCWNPVRSAWVIPGRKLTDLRSEAVRCAEIMDRLICGKEGRP